MDGLRSIYEEGAEFEFRCTLFYCARQDVAATSLLSSP